MGDSLIQQREFSFICPPSDEHVATGSSDVNVPHSQPLTEVSDTFYMYTWSKVRHCNGRPKSMHLCLREAGLDE